MVGLIEPIGEGVHDPEAAHSCHSAETYKDNFEVQIVTDPGYCGVAEPTMNENVAVQRYGDDANS